jgi:hypothetical protein
MTHGSNFGGGGHDSLMEICNGLPRDNNRGTLHYCE